MRPIVREASAKELPCLEELWKALYQHQSVHGMQIKVPEAAFVSWVEGLKPVLGRFATVIIAESSGVLVGFLAGRVRMLPPYFGGEQVGFIGEVFVSAKHRSKGIGERMLTAAVEWYRERSIRRVELQVFSKNPRAFAFYERLGRKRELVQLTFDVD